MGDIGNQNPILYALQEDNHLKEIEEWEFEKSYKYSILFDAPTLSKATLEQMVADKTILTYEELGESYEELLSTINVLSVPIIKFFKDFAIIKFNMQLNAITTNGLEMKNRYPICAVFFYTDAILELRFDSIKNAFNIDKFIYVNAVQEWFDNKLNQKLYTIDCQDFISPIFSGKQQIIKEYQNNVYTVEQDMILHTGGKATIGIGNDKRKIIPFIGELKELMIEEEELFNQNEEIKKILQDFILEKERFSYYPWVKLGFTHSNDAIVKLMFDYDKRGYTLFNHITDNKSVNFKRERMNDVTDFIIKTRRQFKESKS